MEENGEKVIKIIFLGESQVGKTSLLHRFTKGIFKEQYAPVIRKTLISIKFLSLIRL